MADDDSEVETVGRVFVTLLTLAYVGAFIGFVPLLTLLLPLQAGALAPADRVGLLSLLALIGGIVASGSNLAAGWASDRTRGRHGRRRPWIVLGLVGLVGSYAVIATASSPASLTMGVVMFQLAFNFMFAPLTAILADCVPGRQKGRVAAFLGLGAPMGALSGVLVAGPWLTTISMRMSALALIVAVLVLPLVLFWREPPFVVSGAEPSKTKGSRTEPRVIETSAGPDFGFTWISRFCLQITASIIGGYMLFYLADHARYAEQFPGSSVESGLARLIAISTGLVVIAGFVGGLVSDGLGRRKPFILLAAIILAAGLLVFSVWPNWPGPLVGYVLYGIGFGLYATVDVALVTQVLPSRRHTARDLGVMNLTNTLPAAIAPLVALAALGPDRQNWPTLMVTAAAIAVLGGICVLGVRRVA